MLTKGIEGQNANMRDNSSDQSCFDATQRIAFYVGPGRLKKVTVIPIEGFEAKQGF